MHTHVIFAAPFLMDATVRFIAGAAAIEDIRLSVISQDPLEKLPVRVRNALTGHWRVGNALDPEQLVAAVRALEGRFGKAERLFGPLEQLQVPLAIAREVLHLPGLDPESAINFRDKDRMKTVLTNAGVPCARHALIHNRSDAFTFADRVGFPLVVKPLAGAGGKSTFRLDSSRDLEMFLNGHPPDTGRPALFEEFVHGTEYSFDSVFVNGRPVWHSISCYMPSPLEVMENAWIQWCVMLPRNINSPSFDPIREAAFTAIPALGLDTGLSHMEWFRLPDGRIAVSEVGARPPGAQITSLLSYAHDVDFYQAWPRLMALDSFDPPQRRFAAGAAYFRGQGQGRIQKIHGLKEAQAKYGDLVVEARLPQTGQPPSDSYEGDGFVILRHPETSVVEDALRHIVSMVRVELA